MILLICVKKNKLLYKNLYFICRRHLVIHLQRVSKAINYVLKLFWREDLKNRIKDFAVILVEIEIVYDETQAKFDNRNDLAYLLEIIWLWAKNL